MYTRVQGPLFCGDRESILDLISIFSLHFDIHLLDFVVLAYPMKRRLTIGNSRIDRSTTDTERFIVSNTQLKFEEDIISS